MTLPTLRLQVAIAASKFAGIDPMPVLLDVLSSGKDDPLLPQVVWQNLRPLLITRPTDFSRRVESMEARSLKGLSPIVSRAFGLVLDLLDDAATASRLLGKVQDEVELSECLDMIAGHLRDSRRTTANRESLRREFKPILTAMASGPSSGPSDHARILLAYCGDPSAQELARTVAAKRSAPIEDRLRAFQAVAFLDPPGVVRMLVRQVLTERMSFESPGFLGKFIDTLGDLPDPELAHLLLDAYPKLPPNLQPRAVEVLSDRPEWSKALLAAVATRRVPVSAVNLNQLRKLQRSTDPTIAGQVEAIWGTIREGRNPRRELVVGQIRSLVRRTPGDPRAGRAVFKKLCAQCHKIHGDGVDVGPDITSNGRNDFEQLLSNIFDPSLVIGPAYQVTTVATADGRVFTGLLAEDTAERIVLKLQGGKTESIPRAAVEEVKRSELSMMPEEIENQLSPGEIADLLAFLSFDKPPEDPTARRLPGAGPIERSSR